MDKKEEMEYVEGQEAKTVQDRQVGQEGQEVPDRQEIKRTGRSEHCE